MERTLAHISDLHLGRDRRTDANVARLAVALREAEVDAVLVTGDVTHRGRRAELAAFEAIFAPLRDRTVVVPGNHDRLGEDVARRLMPPVRVAVEARPGLHVVRLDSTAPHNRALLSAHGELSDGDIAAVDSAVRAAPPGTLVALMLHHHLLPLPEDHLSERLASWLGWPNAAELARGRDLLEALAGRCDLVAHGHRHAASSVVLPSRAGRPLHVMNAGSTPELCSCRVLVHAHGRIVAERRLELDRPSAAPAARPLPAAA
ncbi:MULTISPECIES: metallophosphoesterase [Anaeromyxobacter]|uniref:metallophosphoesterase family protein n=1 Tax=Anaeromyxobacter TaxID=161492 RepID=UPI001F5A4BBA|nr:MULTISPECIES: metallophosphoesterase [unclassified Anaeromyxobacter]